MDLWTKSPALRNHRNFRPPKSPTTLPIGKEDANLQVVGQQQLHTGWSGPRELVKAHGYGSEN